MLPNDLTDSTFDITLEDSRTSDDGTQSRLALEVIYKFISRSSEKYLRVVTNITIQLLDCVGILRYDFFSLKK